MKKTSFALRTAPEIKQAAKALVRVYFEEPSGQEDGRVEGVYLGSINEALNYLMLRGLDRVLTFVQQAVFNEREFCNMWNEVLRFFLDHPEAQAAIPANFGPGSQAQKFITELMEQKPQDFPHGVDQHWVSGEFASSQRNIVRLTEAFGAIQKALAPAGNLAPVASVIACASAD